MAREAQDDGERSRTEGKRTSPARDDSTTAREESRGTVSCCCEHLVFVLQLFHLFLQQFRVVVSILYLFCNCFVQQFHVVISSLLFLQLYLGFV